MPSVRFKKILIANRGEIAVRVICACKELGIQTVAVYSEADRYSSHVRFADQAICIGPAKSARSYLDIPSIISAAEITNVDAIHPGYGFLSENAGFAEVCEASRHQVHRPAAGSDPPDGREGARPRLHARDGRADSARVAGRAARRRRRRWSWPTQIGYPVILKASAGGGGRGMRIVNQRRGAALRCSLQAQNEAGSAFSSADVYLEKFIGAPRHIEFQVLADEHGNVEILGERECSIQRRHQKLLEESPSPAVTDAAARRRSRRSCARRIAARRATPTPARSSS